MNSLNVLTVIQARTVSTRLPYKVMMSICGKPLLVRMYERVKSANLVGRVIVATSTNKEDDLIEELCLTENIEYFRGHPLDLLDRHYNAALKYSAETIVKIPSDCPLIDPNVIDKVIYTYLNNYNKYDYVSNLHPASYPDGNDVEIFSMYALEKAWKNAIINYQREHTTPYIWENDNEFSVFNVKWEKEYDYSHTHRWTIDYEEDYMFIREVYEQLYPSKIIFTMEDILKLLEEKPYLNEINKKYLGNYWYDNHLEEIKNIQEFKNKKSIYGHI